jgi:hypothetical protein
MSKRSFFILTALSLFGLAVGVKDHVAASTLDVKTLKRGLLNVKVDHNGCGEIKGLYSIQPEVQNIAAVIPMLGAPLVPPLVQAGVGELGSALVRASGKNDTLISLSGLSTSYFYCIQRVV